LFSSSPPTTFSLYESNFPCHNKNTFIKSTVHNATASQNSITCNPGTNIAILANLFFTKKSNLPLFEHRITICTWKSIAVRLTTITDAGLCIFQHPRIYKRCYYLNTTNILPRHFGLYQRPSSEEACSEKLVDSSSGSCDNSDATWQEIGRTCDSVYSCPRPGSRIGVPLRICTASSIQDRELDKSTTWIRSSTHSKTGMTILEPGQGQLHAEPHIRPISCHVASLSWQEAEELNKLLLM